MKFRHFETLPHAASCLHSENFNNSSMAIYHIAIVTREHPGVCPTMAPLIG